MKDKIRETLAFKDLTPEEKKERGILGRLYGPCADIINCTRNGRKYSDELWEKVFKSPLVVELFKNGGIPGEAQHPADRQEIDTEKIAIMMPEAPKKDDDGRLIAYWDIIDTPCGRILYQLAKYGFKLGISSRGTGEIIGDEVDPDSYEFTCFDAVLIPAVECARLQMTEGLNTSMEQCKKALATDLNNADSHDKQIMQNLLENLNIDVSEKKELNECNNVNCSDKNVKETSKTDTNSKEAINDGTDEIIKSLQEALLDKTALEDKIKDLQVQLAVSNTKVNESTSKINDLESIAKRLSLKEKEAKILASKVIELEETLKQKNNTIHNQKAQIQHLNELFVTSTNNENKTLNESLINSNNEVKVLNEKLVAQKKSYEDTIKQLNEQLKDEKLNSINKTKSLNESITKLTNSRNGYKDLAQETIDSYIELKSTMIGVTPIEIKNKLPESYSVKDIDRVCEETQNYFLNINRLPFSIGSTAKIKVNEGKRDNITSMLINDDDVVDDSLIQLAKLN